MEEQVKGKDTEHQREDVIKLALSFEREKKKYRKYFYWQGNPIRPIFYCNIDAFV